MLRRRELVEQAYEQVTTTLGRISISGTIARDHSKRRDTTYQLLDLWTGLWRDALLHRVGLGEQAAYPEVADRLAGWPTRLRSRTCIMRSGLPGAAWTTSIRTSRRVPRCTRW